MTSIKEARKIDASLTRVWRIVSDVDRDPDYWNGLSLIKNIREEENLVEREVVVGFMGRKAIQRITLRPKESIQLDLLTGPLRGSRLIRLVPRGISITRVEVTWEIEFSEIPPFAQGFVRYRLEENTREALERIARAAETQRK